MSEQEKRDMREKIVTGIALAFARLVEEKKREDAFMAFSVNRKVVRLRARDL